MSRNLPLQGYSRPLRLSCWYADAVTDRPDNASSSAPANHFLLCTADNQALKMQLLSGVTLFELYCGKKREMPTCGFHRLACLFGN